MELRRLFDLLPYQEHHYPQAQALNVKLKATGRRAYDTVHAQAQCIRVAAGALELHIGRGDCVAIISQAATPRWLFLDMGLMMAGAITTPIHADRTDAELLYMLQHCAAKACFCHDLATYKRILALKPQLHALHFLYCYEDTQEAPSWPKFIKQPDASHFEQLDALRAVIHEDDAATLIYTAGIAGPPKGVLLSHRACIMQVAALRSISRLRPKQVALSFHAPTELLERLMVYAYVAAGMRLHFVERKDDLIASFKELRPVIVHMLPRTLERLYNTLLRSSLTGKPRWRQRMVLWAIQVGERYNSRDRIPPQYLLLLYGADALLYRRWRMQLGGKLHSILVSGMDLRQRLGRLFTSARIDVRNGYGLAETTGLLALNRFKMRNYRLGSVGRPLREVAVRIAHQNAEGWGEIQAQSDAMMIGYHRPENTDVSDKAFEDGWFRTGDIGYQDKDGYLYVKDRKQHFLTTLDGQHLPPLAIELALKDARLVEQCMVLGHVRPYLTALLVPSHTMIGYELGAQYLDHDLQEAVTDPAVVELYRNVILRYNESAAPLYRIRKFYLIGEEWTRANGLLTSGFKLNRKALEARYERAINLMYIGG